MSALNSNQTHIFLRFKMSLIMSLMNRFRNLSTTMASSETSPTLNTQQYMNRQKPNSESFGTEILASSSTRFLLITLRYTTYVIEVLLLLKVSMLLYNKFQNMLYKEPK